MVYEFGGMQASMDILQLARLPWPSLFIFILVPVRDRSCILLLTKFTREYKLHYFQYTSFLVGCKSERNIC